MGVGPSPMRATSIPLPVSPSTSAASSAGELSLPSRPMATRLQPFSARIAARARPSARASASPSVSSTTPPTSYSREVFAQLGVQDVAADDAEVGRRLGGLRLLEDAAHLHEAAVILLDVEDAVAVGVLARHFHHCDDVAVGLVMRLDHLRQAGLVGEDEIVGEQHRKGLISHQVARAPHGSAKAHRHPPPPIAYLTPAPHTA